MSVGYEQRKKEIVRVLTKVAKKQPGFFNGELFYRKKHGSPRRELMVSPKDYKRMLNIVFDPDLEYALYVDSMHIITPSLYCIRDHDYRDVVKQFISYLPFGFRDAVGTFIEGISGVVYTTGNKDPLSQIFAYRRLLATQWPQRVYFCSHVYRTAPNVPDPASLFPSKEAIIAYCMTLHDLAFMEISAGVVNVYNQLRSVGVNASDKLRYNGGLSTLWEQDPAKACDINLIESIIRDEIEEADKLMRRYGIFRVAFPLE